MWAFMREAQTKTLSLPNTGQAIGMDLGHAGNIHPQRKQEIGRRLRARGPRSHLWSKEDYR